MKKIIGALLCFPLFVFGQPNGIKFQTGLSWKQLKDKARAENKFIFMDCYATWCGPCKWMSANVFPQKEVGEFMNAHFISVAVQMDRTAKDRRPVTNWYVDAAAIAKKYQVSAYPTYLFFSPDGEALHRFTGATNDSREFLEKANEALDPTKQYYAENSVSKIHLQDTAFLWKRYLSARNEGDDERANDIGKAYLKLQPNLISKRNIQLIVSCHLIRSSSDSLFKFFVSNVGSIDALHVMPGIEHYTAWSLEPVIFKEAVEPLQLKGGPLFWHDILTTIQKKYPELDQEAFRQQLEEDFRFNISDDIRRIAFGLADPDWQSIIIAISGKYPGYDFQQLLLEKKAFFYAKKQRWAECAEAAYSLMQNYGDRIDTYHMNNIAWDWVFIHCNNRVILSEAVKWMQQKLEAEPGQVNGMDTYANLLYKLGDREQAILWETKAIEMSKHQKVSQKDIEAFQANLEKIKAGVKTWNADTSPIIKQKY